MKNIFFYGNIIIDDKSIGITKKVLSQIKALRNMGYNVYFTGYTNEGIAIFNNDNKVIKHYKYWTKSTKLNRYLRRWNLLIGAQKFISEANINFHYAYLRFHFFDSKYVKLLKKLKESGSKVIVEAHGYPYRSYKLSAFTLSYVIDYFYEPLARNYIDMVAAISNCDNIWECKTIQIDNAINLDEINLQKKVQTENGEIRLISVSNERPYHGYPKLVKGLYDYYKKGGNRDIIINFIGDFKASTKALVNELNLDKHVFFSGKKYGHELEEIYDKSNLGIGALSSRAGSEYGSSIKTKEYFAKGLPFINGWKEYAFNDDYPYVKRFPLTDEQIDFDKVIKFYDSIKDDKNMQFNMREFAKEHYTWKEQFEKVFSEV